VPSRRQWNTTSDRGRLRYAGNGESSRARRSPDDETLWAGGTLLMHGGWTTFVGTLCRAGDEDRAPKFFRALERLGAKGKMADLDDGPAQSPLDEKQVRSTLLSLVPGGHCDLIMTHAPKGEYTRHVRHEEVLEVCSECGPTGDPGPRTLAFRYEDGDGRYLPRPKKRRYLVEVPYELWEIKRRLLTEIYGFVPESWEVQTAPRREALATSRT